MKISKKGNRIFVENRSPDEAEILFDFITMLHTLKVEHGYEHLVNINSLLKIEMHYNKQQLKEKLKVFRDKKLI